MSIIVGKVHKNPSIIFVTEEESYAFEFTAMNNCEGDDGGEKKIIAEDGFIHVKTNDGYNMAIPFSDSEFDMIGDLNLKTDAYLVTTANVEPDQLIGFDGIAFVGGSLQSIIWNNALDIDQSKSDRIVVNINKDDFSRTVDIGSEKITINIESNISIKEGQKESSISSGAYELKVLFEEEKPLADAFDHCNKIKDLLSFLTYRKNVGFDEIALLKKRDDIGGYEAVAEVYIKDNENDLRKNYFSNLNIDDIKPVFNNLIKVIYAQDEEEGFINLGFIPENDEKLMIMSNYKLRDICTSLECELGYVKDINIEKNEELESLKEIVKEDVKEFRKNSKTLEEGTYGSIFTSISRWDASIKERILAICEKYKEEVDLMNDTPYKIDEDTIKKVVDHRHAITHGRNSTLTVEIAKVAHILAGVIYCCVLERIGIDREKIKEICKDKLLR